MCVTDTSDDGFDFQTFLRPLFRNGANSNLTRYASAVPWGEGEGLGERGRLVIRLSPALFLCVAREKE